MKYDFELDLVNNNSLSWILEQLKGNTTVLEFGPANGRLTKYMKEQLNCKVYLAEIDEEAGKEALQYGEDLVVGDVENYEWLERYQDIRFDFMVFADVLEHLRNPEELLVRAKHLLKPDGTILLSVPNLAHNSVLINLLNNKFEYTQVGLLDNTHIHMFTKESLENMLRRAGLCVEKRIGAYCPVGSNEIANTVDDVPGLDRSYWLSRDCGEVYQFVYAVKKGMEYIEQEDNKLIKQKLNYYAQLFVGAGECSESNSVKNYLEDLNKSHNLAFYNVQHGAELRFDPLNAPCIVQVEQALAYTASGIKELRVVASNASYRKEGLFVFESADPIVQLKTDFEEVIERLEIYVKYILFNEAKIKEISSCLSTVLDTERGKEEDFLKQISNMAEQIRSQQKEVERLRTENVQMQDAYQELQNANQELQNANQELQNTNQELQNANQELQNVYQHKNAELEMVLQSKKWKIINTFGRKG